MNLPVVLLFVWALVAKSTLFPYPGSFSLLSPKPSESKVRAAFVSARPSKEHHYGQLSLSSPTLLLYNNEFDGANITSIVQKLVKGSYSNKEKSRRFYRLANVCLLSLPYYPLGWRNYLFMIKTTNKSVCTGDDTSNAPLAEIEFLSMARGKSAKRIRIRFSIELHGDELTLTRQQSSKGIVDKEFKLVADSLENILKMQFRSEVALAVARGKQQQSYTSQSKLHLKVRKLRERDKILHPELHKSKSPTVRVVSDREKSRAGAGRYTPSSRAHSRRQVVKGG